MHDMQPFVVTFEFATMPILNGPCTLDAVLCGEIARTVASLDAAVRATPLALTDGGLARLRAHRARRHRRDPHPGGRPERARGARAPRPGTHPEGGAGAPTASARRICSAAIRCGSATAAPGSGPGGSRRCGAVLARVIGIGKRRAAGAGMIDPVSLAVEPVDADPATFGLVTGPDDPEFATARIAPARPLPLALFRRLGGDPADALLTVERVRPPYHDPRNVPEEAVAPWT